MPTWLLLSHCPAMALLQSRYLFYSCLFRGCCLTTGLHATICTACLNTKKFCTLPTQWIYVWFSKHIYFVPKRMFFAMETKCVSCVVWSDFVSTIWTNFRLCWPPLIWFPTAMLIFPFHISLNFKECHVEWVNVSHLFLKNISTRNLTSKPCPV
jgi:hypothetical protein